ncbi:MAG: hydantoinase/oxoprolinase family protein [Actinobacteria bacterium]|nr:hydantoinase/oxoprolinase family protein [Actinomycetota bacterium]
MSRYFIGVDIGGTFTDIVAVENDTGEIIVGKVPSSPPTFVEGILDGLDRLPFSLDEVELFVHGSTIGTNAIIERRGAPTALLTTSGFRDVLLCARATRPDVYDLRWRPGPSLAQRRNIFEVDERMDYLGRVVTELRAEDVRTAARKIKARGIEAVAICFLNSFVNADHEQLARDILREECPDIHISISYEVFPEIREFERTSTAVVNAYIAPVTENYLTRLSAGLTERGMQSDLLIVHSGGGIMSEDMTRKIPARTCYSGPAGGVMGGAYVGSLAGLANVITMDMGGTSCDVALVADGEPLIKPGLHIEHNIPVSFPSIDMQTIGAGGGSIAWIDPGGILKSGPASAGAVPGPACYSRGGELPTTTDAHCVLGRLGETGLLGGELKLDAEMARAAIKTHIADPYGWSVEVAANAILKVANASMINAIRLVSVEQGYDPRDFALVSFGGAGALHAGDLASELGIPTVVFPRFPGLASAFGMLHVDLKHDLIRPLFMRESQISAAQINEVLADLENEALTLLAREGIDKSDVSLQRLFDLKYFPQSSYLTLPGPEGELTDEDVHDLIRLYNETHEREFGYSMPPDKVEVEIGHVRLTAEGPIEKPQLRERPLEGANAVPRKRQVWFASAGDWVATDVYDRERLGSGTELQGPAVIEQFDSTCLIPPGASATVDPYENLLVRVPSGGQS